MEDHERGYQVIKTFTQKDWVVNRLEKKGHISRLECLRNYIPELSKIIASLKDEGWRFEVDERMEFVGWGYALDRKYIVKERPNRKHRKKNV